VDGEVFAQFPQPGHAFVAGVGLHAVPDRHTPQCGGLSWPVAAFGGS
jgi:hypothetical protein